MVEVNLFCLRTPFSYPLPKSSDSRGEGSAGKASSMRYMVLLRVSMKGVTVEGHVESTTVLSILERPD